MNKMLVSVRVLDDFAQMCIAHARTGIKKRFVCNVSSVRTESFDFKIGRKADFDVFLFFFLRCRRTVK